MNEDRALAVLREELNDARWRYNNTSGRVAALDKKIERLQAARSELENERSRFKELRAADSRLFFANSGWKGQTLREFARKGDQVKSENDAFYRGQLTRLLDSIDDEIVRLKQERNASKSLLSRLLSQLNNLSNEIDDFFS